MKQSPRTYYCFVLQCNRTRPMGVMPGSCLTCDYYLAKCSCRASMKDQVDMELESIQLEFDFGGKS